jgi:hypothetical protein
VPDELGVLRFVSAAGAPAGLVRTPTATVAATKAVMKENMTSECSFSQEAMLWKELCLSARVSGGKNEAAKLIFYIVFSARLLVSSLGKQIAFSWNPLCGVGYCSY